MACTYLDCLALLGVGGAHPGGLKLTKDILAKELIDEDCTILDAGSGTGQTSAYIAEQYQCDVIANDMSQIMLEKAKKRFSNLGLSIRTQQGNIEQLPFRNNMFDVVLSESVIAFTQIPKTLAEFKRILKPEGILLAIEMVREQPLEKEDEHLIKEFYGIKKLPSDSEWLELLRASGFTHITIEKFDISSLKGSDLDDTPDFDLSEQVDDRVFDVMKEHHHLSETYKDHLGFSLFRCSV